MHHSIYHTIKCPKCKQKMIFNKLEPRELFPIINIGDIHPIAISSVTKKIYICSNCPGMKVIEEVSRAYYPKEIK